MLEILHSGRIVCFTSLVQPAHKKPQTPEERFDHYVEVLTQTLGHADRAEPLRAYVTGLLLPGDRKSMEPMAARLEPHNVRRKHQSMHHFVADAPWSDERVLAGGREFALPALRAHGPIEVWLLDDTGIPKKGTHSVGVARQYCGQLGKTENCQVAVSLSIANEFASLPLAYQLYLPEEWAKDRERCRTAGVPEEVTFRTKPQIALAQIRAALAAGVPKGVVTADAGYGNGAEFRDALTEMGLRYAVGVLATTRVWTEGRSPLPPRLGPATGGPQHGCGALQSISR